MDIKPNQHGVFPNNNKLNKTKVFENLKKIQTDNKITLSNLDEELNELSSVLLAWFNTVPIFI